MKKVREKLNAKLRKSGGFTLVEMLIVVAIIAILIAVSIPMFSSTLENARHAVDQANMRNAISLGTLEYLGDPTPATTFEGDGKTYKYVVSGNTGKEHQAELDDSTGAVGISPQCTKVAGTSAGLTVTVKHGTDGPEVTLNWSWDNDHIKVSGG